LQDVKIIKNADNASVTLEQKCTSNQSLIEVKLVCIKNDLEFYKITLSDPKITSYKIRSAEKMPIEELTFSFQKVKWEYCSIKSDGTAGSSVSEEYTISPGRR
jgi:type VI protein secretion system component Hcp